MRIKNNNWVTVVTVKILPLHYTDLLAPNFKKSFHSGIYRVPVTFRVTVEFEIG